MPVLALPATACFGSVCAAYRLGASVPEVQTGGTRKAAFRRKEHLQITLRFTLCRVSSGRFGASGRLLGIGSALGTLLIANAGPP